MSITQAHATHTKEMKSLNRISGQLDGIKKMIMDKRYCVDILIQLKAVKNALKTVEINILETHMAHCLSAAAKTGDVKQIDIKVDEIKSLLKAFRE